MNVNTLSVHSIALITEYVILIQELVLVKVYGRELVALLRFFIVQITALNMEHAILTLVSVPVKLVICYQVVKTCLAFLQIVVDMDLVTIHLELVTVKPTGQEFSATFYIFLAQRTVVTMESVIHQLVLASVM